MDRARSSVKHRSVGLALRFWPWVPGSSVTSISRRSLPTNGLREYPARSRVASFGLIECASSGSTARGRAALDRRGTNEKEASWDRLTRG
jgi:hypothetical protein